MAAAQQGYPCAQATPEGVVGTVYLACLERRIGSGARHYLGWTSDPEARVADHRAGRGAKLLKLAKREGVAWEITRTWEGKTRAFERELKNRKNAAQLCPNCKKRWLKKRNRDQNKRRRIYGRSDRP